MIDIQPDPNHPEGGFARINLDQAPAQAVETIRVFNSYHGKWLGPDGWQANAYDIPVEPSTGAATITIGPMIVNQIEEDTPIRLVINGTDYDCYWPDNINKRPEMAVIGGIGGTGAAPIAKAATAVVATPSEETLSQQIAVEENETSTPEGEPSATEGTDAGSKGGLSLGAIIGIFVGLLAVIAAALAVAWYLGFLDPYLYGEDTPEEPAVIEEPTPEQEPTPEPAPEETVEPAPLPTLPEIVVPVEPDQCSQSALVALAPEGFPAVAAQIRSCGTDVSANAALRMIEIGSVAGNGEALNIFGALYDSEVTESPYETDIGLNFSDTPALAAEYYSRAKAAGNTTAPTRLSAVCARLQTSQSTLDRTAYEDYCTE